MDLSRKTLFAGLTATAIFWSASFIFIKIALREISPFNLAFYRFLIATPLLYFLMKEKIEKPSAGDFPALIFLALSGVTLLYAIQFLALLYTTATNSSILMNLSAIFVSILSFLAGERLNLRKASGVLLAFAGVFLTVSKGRIHFSSETLKGDLLILFDALLWALYTIGGKKLLEKYSSETLTFYAFLLGTVMLFPFAFYETPANPVNFSKMLWISLIFLSAFCSVISYSIWYRALEEMDATKVAVFVYLTPLFTAVLAHAFLQEDIGLFTVFGAAFIISGVYLVERS